MARSLAYLGTVGVDRIPDVGPKRAAALGKLGIRTVLDLLMHYPLRHLDLRESSIAELVPGEEGTVVARVRAVETRRLRGRKTMVTGTVADARGSTLEISFFNQPWRERQLRPGAEFVFHGKVKEFRGRPQMSPSRVDPFDDVAGSVGAFVPVYPQSEKAKVRSTELEKYLRWTLDFVAELTDPVPEYLLDRHDLVPRTNAFFGIHFPESKPERAAAEKRLIYDELFRLQVALVTRKRQMEQTEKGVQHVAGRALVDSLLTKLAFQPTDAQTRAIIKILDDLRAPGPMHRLLQGDVGAGKTVVAVAAMVHAVEGGHQAALMAPTEVLAEQHHLGVAALLDGFAIDPDPDDPGQMAMFSRPLRVELLTGRIPAARRRDITEALARGEVDVVIGTHALLSDDVAFPSLGLAVVDEQHRFGVEQRAALRDKAPDGATPDLLVMTATPIPRTAAMTVYGDLDVSVLDELPPGRTPIETIWARDEADETAVWDHVRRAVAEGRQAYVVCPLVEASDDADEDEAASATETREALAGGELHGLRLGLLHGRVHADEKASTMAAFRAGRIDVLVATTVIEVGVDVPNATVMVILDADRFGLAQLHQLRGRVGRGAVASTCYLVGDTRTTDGEERLQAMVDSTDGFHLAEVDLRLRGEGTILGVRQKGRSDLRLASLVKHRVRVERARDDAIELVDAGVPEDLADEVAAVVAEDDEEFLLKG